MEEIKILVVDDESRMRKLVKDFLTKKGFVVLEAADGEEAVDLFYEDKDIALIILDVMMPKMDGWEVCREVRKNSKVPIIMLTARSDERDELLGFDLGVDEYISKPFSEKTAEMVDQETKVLIDKAHQMAKDVLESHMDGFKELANLLLEKEVIFAEDLERIYGPRVKEPEIKEPAKDSPEDAGEKEVHETAEEKQ